MPSPDLTNIIGWWDGSDGASITTASGAVTQWNDKGGGARHMTVPIGSEGPFVTAALRNSLSAVQFQIPDNLVFAGSNVITGTTGTLFIVYRMVGAAGDYARIFSCASTGGSGYDWDNDASFSFGQDPNTGPGAALTNPSLTRNYGAHGGVVTGNPGSIINTWIVVTAVFNGTTAELFVNGASVGTPGSSTGTFDIDRIGIASDVVNNGSSNIDVAEIVLYSDGKTGTARTDIESYLNTKWGFVAAPTFIAAAIPRRSYRQAVRRAATR